MAMAKHDRRQFLTTTAVAAGAAAFAVPAFAQSRASANGRIRVGLVGLGGRMGPHVAALTELADPTTSRSSPSATATRQARSSPKNSTRSLPASSSPASPTCGRCSTTRRSTRLANALGDRWHALPTIWACQAGKDVYVEKPGTHNLFEGRQMMAAARKYNRIVQHGTQNRSSPNIREGIAKLREGVIGQLYMARAIDYKLRGHLGKITPGPAPNGLDWDEWLGPKALRPYSQFSHRRWYWLLDLSSGEFANQMVHEMDVIRWGLGLDRHPTLVTAIGGKYVHDDDRTAPSELTAAFASATRSRWSTCEHRSWYTNGEAGIARPVSVRPAEFPVGTIFFGSEGYFIFPDYSSYYTFLGPKREPGPSQAAEGHPMMDAPHFENWLDAIRTRDYKLLHADIAEGHKSMVPCLLARTAYELDRPMRFRPGDGEDPRRCGSRPPSQRARVPLTLRGAEEV